MPYEIRPYSADTYVRPAHTQAFSDPAWKWLANQEYDVNRAWAQQGNYRRGTLSGGPSYERFLDFGNEQQWAVYKPRPVLTTPILQEDAEQYRRALGAVEWDSINPFNTVDQVADQVAQASGGDPLAFLRGASDFLASKDIDIMGMGSTGAPVRAADYALAFPIAVFNKMTGAASLPHAPLPQDNLYYKFQADPRYWQTISRATPEQLQQLARATASVYVDPSANGYFTEQLLHQFNVDRQKALALTSGNPAIDYQAIKAGAGKPWAVGSGFPKIPVIGTQMAEFLDPITSEERAQWAALPQQQRLELMNHYGLQQMATDFIGSLPALAGFSTVMAVAKGGGVVSRTLAEGYDWLLRGSGWVATAGLAAATTNWALEATWPGYSEFIGEDVDRARPISNSMLAGTVNAIGYWATGTYGASNIIRTGAKGLGVARQAGLNVRSAAAAERGLRSPSAGLPELTVYNVGHGGSRYDDLLVQTGLDWQGLRLSKQRLIMSEAVHLMRRPLVSAWDAINNGLPTGRAEIDALPAPERILAANDDLQRSLANAHFEGSLAMRVLASARQTSKLFQSDEALRIRRWYVEQARTIDQEIAHSYMGSYGPGWVTRTAGEYTESAMRKYTEGALIRLGADPTPLAGIRGEESWAKLMRSVHQYEFDYRNGELQAALAAPGKDGLLPREANQLSVVSARHLFSDEAGTALSALRSGDEVAVRAEIDRIILNTIEGERWFSNDWKPPEGAARERSLVSPEDMARWIEDVQPALLVRRGAPDPHADTAGLPLNALHMRLANDGVWDLAFKPTDADGNFVSYVHTRDKVAFQTPWLDYPLGNVDNIELGNRGFAQAKLDSVFRGFRTWRIVEFQRGLMYRSLTSRFDFTASQVDAFHTGLLKIARRHNVQPQSIGTVMQGLPGIGTAYEDAVESLARSVFGEGPFLAKTGERIAVDWRKEIAQSYRQSLRLNLTAGLTSHLKSRLGPVGSSVAWMSDIGYVALRFGLSPLFKAGEVLESKMFNAMAGANPLGTDPWTDALMFRHGLGNDYGVLGQELAYDQTLQGLQMGGHPKWNEATARQARSYSFYARQAPETFEQKAKAAALQARVEAHQAFVQGGGSVFASPRHALEVELASLIDDAGNVLPGMDDRADELVRILDSSMTMDDIRAAHHVGPELPNDQWSTDPLDMVDQGGGFGEMLGPDWVDASMRPEDRGLWHATTAMDAVHNTGLKSSFELYDSTTGLGPVGLGGASHAVSVTTEYMHAESIASRLRVAAGAARNELKASEIADEFLTWFDGLMMPDEAVEKIGHWAAVVLMGKSVGVKALHQLETATTEDELFALLDAAFTRPGIGGEEKYRLVQMLDGLLPKSIDEIEATGQMHVGLIGSWVEMTRIDPRQIGIMQVGVKKGAYFKGGPDTFEVRLHPDDLWVLDRRILDQPLATDREGLLAQLRAAEREDGTVRSGFEYYHDSITAELGKLDAIERPPLADVPADTLEDVFGTPEALTKVIREQGDDAWFKPSPYDGESFLRRAWEELKNPVPGKQVQANMLVIEKLRREFPILVRASGNDGFAEVMGKQLGIPERDWLPFMLEDRRLATAFHNSGDPADLQRLMEHAGPDARGQFDELYASEEWAALTGLFSIANKSASDEAFRVHFFNPYRNAIERSLNHPLMGIYPLSWAYKAAREWMRFLFENRSIPELRLGMSPAVAISSLVRAQNIAFAQANPEDLETYIGTTGPFGSTLMIFNLLLPGDWSTIPFPASRTIRDLIRGNFSARTVENNIASLGAARDARLGLEMAGELRDFVWGPDQPSEEPPWRPHPNITPYSPGTLTPDNYRQ